MKFGMPQDRLYVTYFGGENGLDSDEETKQLWLDMGFVPLLLFSMFNVFL